MAKTITLTDDQIESVGFCALKGMREAARIVAAERRRKARTLEIVDTSPHAQEFAPWFAPPAGAVDDEAHATGAYEHWASIYVALGAGHYVYRDTAEYLSHHPLEDAVAAAANDLPGDADV